MTDRTAGVSPALEQDAGHDAGKTPAVLKDLILYLKFTLDGEVELLLELQET